jgi:hypothetical protein
MGKNLVGKETPLDIKHLMASFRHHGNQLKDVAKDINGSCYVRVILLDKNNNELQHKEYSYHWSNKGGNANMGKKPAMKAAEQKKAASKKK